jgi:hypothetical protein
MRSSSLLYAVELAWLVLTYEDCVGSPELPAAVQKEPMLRQMLGIARADGADDYYSPKWLEAHPRPDMR